MTKGYDEKRTPEQIAEEKARHESLKKKLKIGGTAVLAVGLVCTIVAFVNFFTVFGNPDAGMPKLLFLGFIGMPLIAIGAIMLVFGFRREMGRFVKNESMPVVREAAEELTPTIEDIASAVRGDGKTECPHCHTANDANSKFCKSCGNPIAVTCPHCGQTVDGDSAFCKNCGKRL